MIGGCGGETRGGSSPPSALSQWMKNFGWESPHGLQTLCNTPSCGGGGETRDGGDPFCGGRGKGGRSSW